MGDRYWKTQHIEYCGVMVVKSYDVELSAIAVHLVPILNSHLQEDDVV